MLNSQYISTKCHRDLCKCREREIVRPAQPARNLTLGMVDKLRELFLCHATFFQYAVNATCYGIRHITL